MIYLVVLDVLLDVKVVVNLLVPVDVVEVVLGIAAENAMEHVVDLVDLDALVVALVALCFLFIVN